MAISWNEIKDRALRFSKEWEGEERERAEKDTFWNEFLNVFGITRRRVAVFEKSVKKLNNKQGFIDLFWPGTLLVEQKSKGRDLDAAFEQATDYFHGLKEHELPKYVLVSDFERFRLYDLDEDKEHEFHIKDFHKKVKLFGFIAGYEKREFKEQDPVNIKAAELMGKLHDELEESGYEGHPLEMYLVRLLFCLFADDTGIFEKDTFKEFIEVKTNEDGSDLGAWLAQFFQVLDTPTDKRLRNLDEHLAAFPYVNGKLFQEPLPIAAFNTRMREILLECSALNWGKISPAIFGSMFQSVMNPEERRNLGAHYTSEKNIMKLIKPLFLDELLEEFAKAKSSKPKLREFLKKLSTLKFLDPACGCGNFLIITYRELRLLELDVLKELYGNQRETTIETILQVDVDQFYGIEYDEFPARIAEVALWLMDHQMNQLVSEAFGLYYARLPLRKSATIVHGNALRLDWEDIVPKTELNYILGNPPFVGASYQNKSQKEDLGLLSSGDKSIKALDYVAGWYIKAAYYIQNTEIQVAFVSTNSISQGEQVAILWGLLNKFKIVIQFAHQTFSWRNEAKGIAGVHVVIIGFGLNDAQTKWLFNYEDVRGEPHAKSVKTINPYLTSGNIDFLTRRKTPICDVPQLIKGNQPTDGGNLIFTDEEMLDFLSKEPSAKKFLKKYIGSRELINGKNRWCLWLTDASPQELKSMRLVLVRINKVKEYRLQSRKAATRKKANTPMLFDEIRHTNEPYLAIPEVSSERRKIIPIGYIDKNTITSNKNYMLPNAGFFEFGIMVSAMHMSWTFLFSGRLESRIQYSNGIVYNNYPWPKEPSEKNKKAVEKYAQLVLDVREEFPDSSLADLYDPLTMPPKLVKAHQQLDRAVDLCYRPQPFPNETSRIEYLFQLYNEYTAPLLKEPKRKKK